MQTNLQIWNGQHQQAGLVQLVIIVGWKVAPTTQSRLLIIEPENSWEHLDEVCHGL